MSNESVSPAPAAGGEAARRQTQWICGSGTDILMALSWVPFTLVALALQSIDGALASLMVVVFLFSFAHQPLTFVLVYGDASRFALKPRTFTWSPVVFSILIVIGMTINPILLAAIGGLWNAEHTLMQRYGITRIYGRKVGQQESGVELYLLFSWLIFVLLWAAADDSLLDMAGQLGLKGANLTSFELLAGLAPWAQLMLPVAAAAVIVLAGLWLNEERKRPVNAAKHLYLLSTAALFVVMLINPIAGFIGYVGAHAYEYFVIVNHNLELQYEKPGEGGGQVGKWVRSPLGRVGFFAVYLTLIVGFVLTFKSFTVGWPLGFMFFIAGALHFYYDGFIWKLRIPAVAKGLGAVR